jgi:Flp pilus assembly pilin Flp
MKLEEPPRPKNKPPQAQDVCQVKSRRMPGEAGQGIVEYGMVVVLTALAILGALAITSGAIPVVFEGTLASMVGSDTPIPPTVEVPQTITVTVKVVNSEDVGIPGVNVLAFDDRGNYLGLSGQTGADGITLFTGIDPGQYMFRADYSSRQFWSPHVSVPAQTYVVILVTDNPFQVEVVNSLGESLPAIPVYAFTGGGEYTGEEGTTDSNGIAEFNLADGSYKFRADYQGQAYWSAVVDVPGVDSTRIVIDVAPFTVTVHKFSGEAASDVPVYVFDGDGGYTGMSGRSDADGRVVFDLPAGRYNFRADYEGNQYWSGVVNHPQVTSTLIEVGKPQVTVQVQDDNGDGIAGVGVYVFDGDGNYLDDNGNTNWAGAVVFELAPGNYMFRVDYLGSSYWSEEVSVVGETTTTIVIRHTSVSVQVVRRSWRSSSPQQGAQVYVYAVNGDGDSTYIGLEDVTDWNGNVSFDLPDGRYIFYAIKSNYWSNYDGWSNIITVPGTTSVSITVE